MIKRSSKHYGFQASTIDFKYNCYGFKHSRGLSRKYIASVTSILLELKSRNPSEFDESCDVVLFCVRKMCKARGIKNVQCKRPMKVCVLLQKDATEASEVSCTARHKEST